MKYIGEYIKPWFDGFTLDHGGFTRCPADRYMECLYYEPGDTIDWDCIHVDGDICKLEVSR